MPVLSTWCSTFSDCCPSVWRQSRRWLRTYKPNGSAGMGCRRGREPAALGPRGDSTAEFRTLVTDDLQTLVSRLQGCPQLSTAGTRGQPTIASTTMNGVKARECRTFASWCLSSGAGCNFELIFTSGSDSRIENNTVREGSLILHHRHARFGTFSCCAFEFKPVTRCLCRSR